MTCIPTTTASVVILVTISYWSFFFGAEIVSTLRLYRKGDQFFHVINITRADNPNSTYHRTNVPLIMHRMWRDDSIIENNNPELPVNWTKAFAQCNEQYRLRNWTTILWTDDSIRAFIEKHYPSFVPTYKSYPYNIQRVDAARYFILYHYGGVYMDLDVGCQKQKDLSDLVNSMEQLEKVAVLPLTQPVGVSNDVLFAIKASPFFKELTDILPIKNKWYGSPYLTVMYSTGPMFLSLQYMRLSPTKQSEVMVLPPELYTERGTRYFKHLRGSTWHQNDVHAIQWMMRSKSVVVVVLFLAVVTCSKVKRIPQKHENKIV
mmetsp:Transcript_33309/g.60011  ORF Transcript_33309/g.60011 Transcript_33309/m.60011 type:complete len:318 (-) Transcript_33309:6-959(-)